MPAARAAAGMRPGVPSADAMYRFLRKLRANPEWLEGLIRALQAAVREFVAQHVDLTITVYLPFGLARLRADSG
jgi:hypothetical protein